MKKDSALSSVVGAVMMFGLVSICFSILYIQVIPMIQQYANMVQPYPSVTGTVNNGTITLLMTQGLPVGTWSLLVDGEKEDHGYGFYVGHPIVHTFLHNSTVNVTLIEEGSNQRMIYYAMLDTEGSSVIPPDPPTNETVKCYQCQDGVSINDTFNGSECPEFWSDIPIDCNSSPPESDNQVLGIIDNEYSIDFLSYPINNFSNKELISQYLNGNDEIGGMIYVNQIRFSILNLEFTNVPSVSLHIVAWSSFYGNYFVCNGQTFIPQENVWSEYDFTLSGTLSSIPIEFHLVLDGYEYHSLALTYVWRVVS